jgi:hypothetical protein
MENVEFIEVESFGGTVTHAIVTLSNDSYESMTKVEYERRLAEAEQSTPLTYEPAKPVV